MRAIRSEGSGLPQIAATPSLCLRAELRAVQFRFLALRTQFLNARGNASLNVESRNHVSRVFRTPFEPSRPDAGRGRPRDGAPECPGARARDRGAARPAGAPRGAGAALWLALRPLKILARVIATICVHYLSLVMHHLQQV